tara:strand:- start:46 stop:240 length:195 start_codon:yes stop_codon:yes gene_type:complete
MINRASTVFSNLLRNPSTYKAATSIAAITAAKKNSKKIQQKAENSYLFQKKEYPDAFHLMMKLF